MKLTSSAGAAAGTDARLNDGDAVEISKRARDISP